MVPDVNESVHNDLIDNLNVEIMLNQSLNTTQSITNQCIFIMYIFCVPQVMEGIIMTWHTWHMLLSTC